MIPLGKRVLVKQDKAEEMVGSLYVPEKAKEKPVLGTVVATGSEVKDVKNGDRIMFQKYGGTEVNLVDGQFLIMTEDSIYGIINEG